MKKLTPERWETFFWDKSQKKFKGISFEELVTEILKCEYPGENWERTQISWDGKKDFAYTFWEENQCFFKWAECKMHRDNLSINILAPTLIMSTLRPVNEILIFSYSKLNSNARSSLAEFAEIHRKTIRIYDDEKLESLIFKHKEKICFHRFFPDYFDIDGKLEIDGSLHCEERIYIYRQNRMLSRGSLARERIRVNELIEIWVEVENATLQQQEIQIIIDLQKSGADRFFESAGRLLKIEKSAILQAGEIISAVFPFRITNYAPKTALPPVEIRKKQKTLQNLQGEFMGTWLIDIPLIGFQNFLEAMDEFYSLGGCSIGTLHGSGGVGKTRLLREIQSRYVLNGNKSIWVSAVRTNFTALVWLRRVFSQLYTLPLFEVLDANLCLEENSIQESVAMRILYDMDYSITDNKVLIAHALLDALSKQKHLLVLDDLQDFDGESLDVVNAVLNAAENYAYVRILISFNTDLLTVGSKASHLFYRLEKLRQEDPNGYRLKKIDGLTPEQAVMYIKHCLGYRDHPGNLASVSYDAAIRLIASMAHYNPLYMEQILRSLCEQRIICNNGDHFYLYDNQRLEQGLNHLPEDMERSFDRRWREAKALLGETFNQAKNLIQCLCFFGELPGAFLSEEVWESDVLDFLIQHGFVSRQERIVFYHQLIGRFFSRKYPSFPQKLAQLFLKIIEKHQLTSVYPAQYYICLFQCRRPQEKQVSNAIEVMLNRRIPESMVGEYSRVLFNVLETKELFKLCQPELLLEFYSRYCYHQQAVKGNVAAGEVYQHVYEMYLSRYPIFRSKGEQYFLFIKEYLNVLLVLHQNPKVIAIVSALLENIHAFSFSSQRQRSQAEATVLNRLHVALSRTGQTDETGKCPTEALNPLQKSLTIARALNDSDRIIQNEIDYGYVYYLFRGPYEKTVWHWFAAEREWAANRERVPSWEGGVYYHVALASTIEACQKEGSFAKVLDSIKKVEHFYSRNLITPYFLVKTQTLKTVVFMMQQEAAEEILQQLIETENLCQTSGITGLFAVCSYLKGMLSEHWEKKLEQAAIYYEKAIWQYANKCSNGQEERDFHTLKELAMALRRCQGASQTANRSIAAIKHAGLRVSLEKIITLSEEDWIIREKEPPFKGALFHAASGLNYPCF